jgi:hypothetical protein
VFREGRGGGILTSSFAGGVPNALGLVPNVVDVVDVVSFLKLFIVGRDARWPLMGDRLLGRAGRTGGDITVEMDRKGGVSVLGDERPLPSNSLHSLK